MMKYRNKCILTVLLLFAVAAIIVLGVFFGVRAVKLIAAQNHTIEKTETIDPSDKVYIAADYDRKIFGPYRFNRGSSKAQFIYEQLDSDEDPETVLVDGGIIEKYIHDESRFIAYHYTKRFRTEQSNGGDQSDDGEQYYAILDTQTKVIERFPDIEALSKTIQERNLHFGNWFYTAAGNSVEGIRIPLFNDYFYEYLNETRGQSILLREIPVFHGILQNVRTDGERYISFRQRTIRNAAATWYDDPVTNALLHTPSKKRIGLYRGGFLEWYSVFYDQYVLFDTRDYTVQEFKNERKLKEFCDLEKISLQDVEIRKQ